MEIRRDCVVCIDYTIQLTDGQLIETSVGAEPLTYLHGRRQIVPGVERALNGATVGSDLEITVSAEDAYGERDAAGVFLVPRELFPDDERVEQGAVFLGKRSDGANLTLRVLEANPQVVLVDSNHPLAGETLKVSVVVRSVRWASHEELCSGRPSDHPLASPEYLA